MAIDESYIATYGPANNNWMSAESAEESPHNDDTVQHLYFVHPFCVEGSLALGVTVSPDLPQQARWVTVTESGNVSEMTLGFGKVLPDTQERAERLGVAARLRAGSFLIELFNNTDLGRNRRANTSSEN